MPNSWACHSNVKKVFDLPLHINVWTVAIAKFERRCKNHTKHDKINFQYSVTCEACKCAPNKQMNHITNVVIIMWCVTGVMVFENIGAFTVGIKAIYHPFLRTVINFQSIVEHKWIYEKKFNKNQSYFPKMKVSRRAKMLIVYLLGYRKNQLIKSVRLSI